MPARRTPTKRDKAGARLLALFLDSGDVPDYITDGAMRVVVEAEAATGIEAVRLDADGIDLKALTQLVAVTRNGLPPQKGGE
jgi:hypothetical protein